MTGEWRRDSPDNRDMSFDTGEIRRRLLRLPSTIDPRESLREDFPLFDGDESVSSVAVACAAVYQYFIFRLYERHEPLAAIFLDRIAGRLSSSEGNGELNIRAVLRALVRYGVPPAKYLPKRSKSLDRDPILFGFARDFESIRYFRLDPPNQKGRKTVRIVRAFVAAGFPSVFGFPLPESMRFENLVGGWNDIRPIGPANPPGRGHAAVIVGYDDQRVASARDADERPSHDTRTDRTSHIRGAFLIRHALTRANPLNGYLWMPYSFVEQRQAVDFWTMLRPDWLRRSRAEEHGRPPLTRPILPGLL
jgi:hypothetical protein